MSIWQLASFYPENAVKTCEKLIRNKMSGQSWRNHERITICHEFNYQRIISPSNAWVFLPGFLQENQAGFPIGSKICRQHQALTEL